MKQDAGLTEITGFLLILTLVILCAAVFTASALPDILEAEERKQNEELLFRFASMQEEMDSLALAEESGCSGKAELEELFPGRTHLSLTYGKELVYGSAVFREAVITYAGEDTELTLGNGGLKKNGKLILPASYRLAVNPKQTREQREITGPFHIEYTWQETISAGGRTYQVFHVRFA